jgi:hypothetical protein
VVETEAVSREVQVDHVQAECTRAVVLDQVVQMLQEAEQEARVQWHVEATEVTDRILVV